MSFSFDVFLCGFYRNCVSFRSTLYDVYGKDASNAALASKKRDMTPEEMKHINYSGPGKKPDNLIDPNKGTLFILLFG